MTTSGTGTEVVIETYDYTQHGDWIWRKTGERIAGAVSGTVHRSEFRYNSRVNLGEEEDIWDGGEALDSTASYVVAYAAPSMCVV